MLIAAARRVAGRAAGLGLLAALLAACGGEGQAAPAGGGRGGPGGPGDRVTPVEVTAVERGSAGRSSTVTGVVEPLRVVGVVSQVGGILTNVLVEEGDVVREGQVLARMDDRELAAQARAAEAQVELTRAAYERSKGLRDAQVVTAAEYEVAYANFEAARAQLDQLRTRLGFATVRAPISGVVTEKNFETGGVAGPQARIFTIADVGTLVVRLPVSELDVAALREGQTVRLTMDALPDRRFDARVRRIFPTADSVSRLVPVEVVLEGEGARRARPGYLARATFALDQRDDALLVPANAVLGASGAEAVFVVEEGQAFRRPVTTGLRQNGRVEILTGLTVGEQVVVAGNTALRDGAKVRLATQTDEGAPRTAAAPAESLGGARPTGAQP